MKRAHPNGKRQIGIAMLAITISMFSSAHAPARDQNYLNSINAEAESMDEVGNTDTKQPTDKSQIANTPIENTPTPPIDEHQESFLQKINSTLYAEPNNTRQDEATYLKQLEKEVKKLDSTPRQPATPTNTTNTANTKKDRDEEVNMQAEKDKLIKITETQREEMEFALESKLPGIYRLYKKLGLTQKTLVVKDYLEDKKVSTASKTVLKLYGGN
jgi:hypothetical protein